MVYVLEVNPRASRTVPFVCKATGQPLAKIAARCMVGQTLAEPEGRDGDRRRGDPAVLQRQGSGVPVQQVPRASTRSSARRCARPARSWAPGRTFGEAMLKSQLGAGSRLPTKGTVCITVKNGDKARAVVVARDLHRAGLPARRDQGHGGGDRRGRHRRCKAVNKVKDGRPHIVDMVKAGEIQLVFTTVDETRTAIADSRHIRQAALAHRVTYYTSMAGCEAAVEGMKHQDRPGGDVAAGTARANCTKLRSTSPRPPPGLLAAASFCPLQGFCTWPPFPSPQRGADKLKEELQRLKTVERHAVIQAIAEARAQGDLSENAEYEAAKDKQGFIEGRIQEIESKLAAAQIIDPSRSTPAARSCSASTVDLEDEDSGAKVTYQIVGDDEADLKLGLISISSPIARALIGKEAGDVAEVQAPGGLRHYEIVDVRYV